MGKLVKYCSECEEGFAERFGFCPNCGGALEAFEMNPVRMDGETEKRIDEETISPPAFIAPTVLPASVPATTDFSDDDILELESVDTREEVIEKEPEVFVAPTTSANTNGFEAHNFAENNFSSTAQTDDDGYHVTVVSEEASSWFKPFLLGLMAFAFVLSIASYVIAIWIHGFQIPQLDGMDEVLYSSLADDEPMQLEELRKKDDKAGGGGGGGGNENPDPASRGRTPTHGNPTPLMITPRMENPSLAINNRVQSNIKTNDDGQQVGITNGADGTSSGRGKGGGIGTGVGTGIGSGEGTGVGSGRGSGTGGGVGDGNGDGTGSGGNNLGDKDDGPQIKKPVGESKPLNITGKPRPNYTDAARQNNVQGTVTLRVTFNANGTIGGVTPVSSLPYGLTEQAIAAAKRMTFTPQMKDGRPVSVTKTIQFSFTIY